MPRVPADRGAGGTGQRLAPRIGALLFLGGACITALATVMPHPGELDTAGFLIDGALQAVAGLILLALPHDLRRARWLPGVVVVIGILAVTAAVYFNGERHGGPPFFNEFFYVWPAFYIGYFFGPRGIAASLVLLAALYAGVLESIGAPTSEGITRWVVTVSVVAFTAIALHTLRRRIDRLVDQLRETARTDPLTMLLNRRGFDERLALELERARRTATPVALLVADLDRFKSLNDRFGHAAGDAALARVGEMLVPGCRSIDTVAGSAARSSHPAAGRGRAGRARAGRATARGRRRCQGRRWPRPHDLGGRGRVPPRRRDPAGAHAGSRSGDVPRQGPGRDRTVVRRSPEAVAPLPEARGVCRSGRRSRRELTAGRVDVAAAGEAHGRAQAVRPPARARKASMAARLEPSYGASVGL